MTECEECDNTLNDANSCPDNSNDSNYTLCNNCCDECVAFFGNEGY